MTVTFTWKISNLERETADGYVYNAHFLVNAEDGVHFAEGSGSIGLERPDTLIPFDELTEEVVVGWVKENLGAEQVQFIYEALQSQLDQKRAPTKADGVPW